MKIERMNKGTWGKVRSFFDLTTAEGFTIKGFKIIEGINGLFVSMPSQKSNDGEYYDSVFASKDLRDELNKIALDSYGSKFQETLANNNETKVVENSKPLQPTEATTNDINEDFIKKEEEEAPAKQPFSDDDIPF